MPAARRRSQQRIIVEGLEGYVGAQVKALPRRSRPAATPLNSTPESRRRTRALIPGRRNPLAPWLFANRWWYLVCPGRDEVRARLILSDSQYPRLIVPIRY